MVTGGTIFVYSPVLDERYCLWAHHSHVYVGSPSNRLERVGLSWLIQDMKTVLRYDCL